MLASVIRDVLAGAHVHFERDRLLSLRPDFDAVYVPHPIQDQTRAEIEAKADAAVEEIVARLIATRAVPQTSS